MKISVNLSATQHPRRISRQNISGRAMRKLSICCFLVCAALSSGICQDLVHDTDAALKYLETRRDELSLQLNRGTGNTYNTLDEMLSIGMWDEVLAYLDSEDWKSSRLNSSHVKIS